MFFVFERQQLSGFENLSADCEPEGGANPGDLGKSAGNQPRADGLGSLAEVLIIDVFELLLMV